MVKHVPSIRGASECHGRPGGWDPTLSAQAKALWYGGTGVLASTRPRPCDWRKAGLQTARRRDRRAGEVVLVQTVSTRLAFSLAGLSVLVRPVNGKLPDRHRIARERQRTMFRSDVIADSVLSGTADHH
jgi:hypothetical protein